jgi:hypothetical protein
MISSIEKNTIIALDRALRYVYHAIRLREGRLLAISFRYRGCEWKADTVKEAVELRAFLERDDRLHAAADTQFAEQLARDNTLWTPDRMEELLQRANDTQKAFLRVLYQASGRIAGEKLASKLSLDSQVVLAGILSGISKLLHTMDLHPTTVFRVEVEWQGKHKTRYFIMTAGFRAALIQDGWFDGSLKPAES